MATRKPKSKHVSRVVSFAPGCITITHVATQRVFLTLTRVNLKHHLNNQLRQLRQFEHSNSELQNLYTDEKSVVAECHPANSVEEAEALRMTLDTKLQAEGRLINRYTSDGRKSPTQPTKS